MARLISNRWLQLVYGIVCMVMVANYQYGWTLFVGPIDAKYHWGRAAIQWAFPVFIFFETWLIPVEGYLVDRFGPRVVVLGGGVLCALSWPLCAYADSLPMLYLGAAVAGVGAGCVYGTSVGNAVKWFPARRGLAASLTSAGYGTGAALTVVPISQLIKSSGYETTLVAFGIGQGLIVLLFGLLLRAPQPAPADPLEPAARGFSPLATLAHPAFWIMYLMFTLVCAGGLVVVAQVGPMAHDLNVADVPVSLLGLVLPALSFALVLDRVMNGITRPFLGWVSDHIGRETTMFIAFGLEGVGVLGLVYLGRDPLLFVLLSGTVFLGWGQIFGLFPAACTDIFGEKFAAANYGLLYTAKGAASLMVPLASVISGHTGTWLTVFWIVAAFDIAAALLALLVLKPIRERAMATR